MKQGIAVLIKNWQARNIAGFCCSDKEEAAQKILEIIPISNSIGISGSLTLEQVGIVKMLEQRGNKVFNPYKPDLSRGQSLEIRRQGAQADYYLTSANAVSLKGELVFFSAYGNRPAGIAYAKNVIVVCGMNKITEDINAALRRSREYATALNCKRLNWNTPCSGNGICREEDCLFPEYKRMCCQILIIEAEVAPDRMKVILVEENLGY